MRGRVSASLRGRVGERKRSVAAALLQLLHLYKLYQLENRYGRKGKFVDAVLWRDPRTAIRLAGSSRIRRRWRRSLSLPPRVDPPLHRYSFTPELEINIALSVSISTKFRRSPHSHRLSHDAIGVGVSRCGDCAVACAPEKRNEWIDRTTCKGNELKRSKSIVLFHTVIHDGVILRIKKKKIRINFINRNGISTNALCVRWF